MQRTFTLARLLVGITVVCLVLGLTVAWPRLALGLTLLLGWALPAAATSGWFAYWSPRPIGTFAWCAGAAVIVGCAAPIKLVTWSHPPTWWDIYVLDFENFAIPAAIGAIVAGCIDVAVRTRRRV